MGMTDEATRADRVTRDLERDVYDNARVVCRNPQTAAQKYVEFSVAHVDAEPVRLRRLRDVIHSADLAQLVTLASHGITPLRDAEVVAMWAGSRVVYTFDPDTCASLVETFRNDATSIPGEVFTRLPHPNPFLLFPTPVRQVNADGHTEEYVGVFVRGVRATAGSVVRTCSTDDDEMSELELSFIGWVVEPSTGRPVRESVATVWSQQAVTSSHVIRLSAITPLTDLTVQQRVSVAVNRMLQARPVHEHNWTDETAAQESVKDLLTLGLSLLVYSVADNADRGRPVTATPRKRKKNRDRSGPPPATVVPLGYSIGADLRAAYRAADDSASGAGTGRKVRPHVRRGHTHTYWRGKRSGPPQDRYRIVKWLPPMFVGGRQPPEATSVHRVS